MIYTKNILGLVAIALGLFFIDAPAVRSNIGQIIAIYAANGKTITEGDIEDCVTNGFCEAVINCPANRACFGTCMIGEPESTAGIAFANIILAAVGADTITPNPTGSCFNNCLMAAPAMCIGTQPPDITTMTDVKDPQALCWSYCQPYSPWCQKTCNRMTWIGNCFRQHPDDADKHCSAAMVDWGSIYNNEPLGEKAGVVYSTLYGFFGEALCNVNPNLDSCKDLCKYYPRAAKCAVKSAEEAKQKLIDDIANTLQIIRNIDVIKEKTGELESNVNDNTDLMRAMRAREKKQAETKQ